MIADLLLKFDKQTRQAKDGSYVIFDRFWPSERYVIDFAPDFSSGGWEQFDTSQDAAYFGVWCNKRQRQTLSYSEGDWCWCKYASTAAYNVGIREMIEFHGEGFVCKALDKEGRWTEYRQDRQRFYITEKQFFTKGASDAIPK